MVAAVAGDDAMNSESKSSVVIPPDRRTTGLAKSEEGPCGYKGLTDDTEKRLEHLANLIQFVNDVFQREHIR